MAVAGKAPEHATWPPKTALPADIVARMEDRLLVAAVVTTADLQHLAEARGEALKHQLVDVRGMTEERVFLKGASVGGGASHQQVACKLDLSE